MCLNLIRGYSLFSEYIATQTKVPSSGNIVMHMCLYLGTYFFYDMNYIFAILDCIKEMPLRMTGPVSQEEHIR